MAKLFINKDIAADADKMKYWLSGEDSVSFSDIQYFLDWIPSDDNRIDIELHSCGGDCVEGYAIYDALRASGKEISCKVVGHCASMATIILLAAPLERRSAFQHAQLLIHSPFYPKGAISSGEMTIEKLQEATSYLTSQKEKMLGVYIERTGKTREELEAQMSTNAWFSPDRAIELGFISSIVPVASASVDKQDFINSNINLSMAKESQTTATVSKSILDRLLAKCGYAKIEDVPAAVGMVITTSTGDELTVEREEGEIQVGDAASPDGEFVLEDGRTVVVQDGVITEIREPKEEEKEDVESLKSRISQLEQQVSELSANAKSDEDKRILGIVKKAGGESWLVKAAASKYTPSGSAGGPRGGKKDDFQEPKGLIHKKLTEAREKNKSVYQKK